MRLVEQHVIKRGDPRYQRLDQAAFVSKYLWNAANYLARQSFIIMGVYLNKTAGRNLLVYEKGAIWKRELDQGVIAVSEQGALVQTTQSRETVDQVHIVPKGDHYVIEVVYQQEARPADVDPALFVEASLGVRVLAALTSNKPDFLPRLVNGGPIKSLNQFYNKQRAHHQSKQARASRFTSRQLERITTKRHRRILHYLHTASRRLQGGAGGGSRRSSRRRAIPAVPASLTAIRSRSMILYAQRNHDSVAIALGAGILRAASGSSMLT
jgi:Probable transposase